MKKIIFTIFLFLSATMTLFAGKPAAKTTIADKAICSAIRNFLLGKPGAAILTSSAKKDIFESSWPEVQCSVDGTLDSPAAYRNLTVKKTGKGKYKYSCICPRHGDKFTDFCTISATRGKDRKVRITHVTWDK